MFAAILEGVRDEELNVIVTIGAGNDPAALGPQPDNVHIEEFIPQSALLPRCDLVINQGGTAILPILANGLPLLVLPRAANQFHNAESCVSAGVARSLLPSEVTAEAVRGEIRALREQPAYIPRARGKLPERSTRCPRPTTPSGCSSGSGGSDARRSARW